MTPAAPPPGARMERNRVRMVGPVHLNTRDIAVDAVQFLSGDSVNLAVVIHLISFLWVNVEQRRIKGRVERIVFSDPEFFRKCRLRRVFPRSSCWAT